MISNDIEKYKISGEKEKKALAILKRVGNLRLIGETGTGKTAFVHYLKNKYNWNLFSDVLNKNTNKWDLLATDVMKEGTTEQRKGIIIRWLEYSGSEPAILYLDGWNYTPASVLSITESLADFRGEVFIEELNKKYYRDENHYLIISMNPFEKEGYSQTFRSNIAQVRRFETLRFDFLSKDKEAELLKECYPSLSKDKCSKLAAFAERTRVNYDKGEINRFVTTGNLKNYADLLANTDLEMEDIVDIASNMFLKSEKGQVQTLFEEELKV